MTDFTILRLFCIKSTKMEQDKKYEEIITAEIKRYVDEKQVSSLTKSPRVVFFV